MKEIDDNLRAWADYSAKMNRLADALDVTACHTHQVANLVCRTSQEVLLTVWNIDEYMRRI